MCARAWALRRRTRIGRRTSCRCSGCQSRRSCSSAFANPTSSCANRRAGSRRWIAICPVGAVTRPLRVRVRCCIATARAAERAFEAEGANASPPLRCLGGCASRVWRQAPSGVALLCGGSPRSRREQRGVATDAGGVGRRVRGVLPMPLAMGQCGCVCSERAPGST